MHGRGSAGGGGAGDIRVHIPDGLQKETLVSVLAV